MLQPGDERYVTADGKLKTPFSFILLTLFFLRGYAAWLISLTFSEDRGRLLQFFYANIEQFVLALGVGLPALIVLFMVLRIQAKTAPPVWLVKSLAVAPGLLFCAWVLDGLLLGSLVASHWPSFSVVKASLLFIWFMSLWLLLFSRQLKAFWRLLPTQQSDME